MEGRAAAAVLCAAALAGCGWTADANEARCRFEADKATASVGDRDEQRTRAMQLTSSCMRLAGFEYYTKGWQRPWVRSILGKMAD